mgnify:CR=1 FL=1
METTESVEVKDITQLELPGGSSKRQYYLLVPQKEKNGRIYSPVESSKVQTRKVITKQEADTLIREIPAIQAAWVEKCKSCGKMYIKKQSKAVICGNW